MVREELLKKRLKHLTEGQYMLNYVTPLIPQDDKEQMKSLEEKKNLLDVWITELEKQING